MSKSLQSRGLQSLPGSFVHGISQTRILEWVVISFSRGSSRSRDWTCVSCIGRWILYHWAIQEAQCLVITIQNLASYCISIGFPCLLPVPLQLTEPLVPCEGGLYTQVGWSWPYSIHASGTALVSETGPWLRLDPQRDVLVSVLWRVSLSPEGVFEAIGDIVWTPGSIQSWSQYERIYVSIYFNKAKLD